MEKNDKVHLNVNTELVLDYVMKRLKLGGYIFRSRPLNLSYKTTKQEPSKVSWNHLFIINFLSEEQSKLKTQDNFPRVVRYCPMG